MSIGDGTSNSPPKQGLVQRIIKSKAFLGAAGAGLVVFIGIQFIPVEGVGQNPTARYELDAPADVKQILEESCYDCHSNETKWPFYSLIAPGSWLMAMDVKDGRDQLNISTWGEFEDEEDIEFEKETMWDSIEDGSMPLWFYIPLHPSASLTDEEKAKLKAWLLAHQDDEDEEEEDEEEGDEDDEDGEEAAGAGDKANAQDAEENDEEGDGDEDDGEGPADPKVSEGSAKAGPTPPATKEATPKPDKPVAAPTPKPAAPAPKPAAPAPAPKKPVSDPCRAKSFKFGSVKSACEKGGVPQAKAMMKSLVKQGKAKDVNYKCSSCHTNQKTYENKPNAVADLRKLMKAISSK